MTHHSDMLRPSNKQYSNVPEFSLNNNIKRAVQRVLAEDVRLHPGSQSVFPPHHQPFQSWTGGDGRQSCIVLRRTFNGKVNGKGQRGGDHLMNSNHTSHVCNAVHITLPLLHPANQVVTQAGGV